MRKGEAEIPSSLALWQLRAPEKQTIQSAGGFGGSIK